MAANVGATSRQRTPNVAIYVLTKCVKMVCTWESILYSQRMRNKIRRNASIDIRIAEAADRAISDGHHESWSQLVEVAVAKHIEQLAIQQISNEASLLDADTQARLISDFHHAITPSSANWSPLHGPR